MAKKKHDANNPLLVVKDNRLMEAKFQFSLWEMRIFERMVSLVEKGATEFRLCRIYIKDLVDFFHSKSHNDYDLVREAAKSLAYKKLHLPYMRDNKRRWAIISVFPTVTTPDSEERGGENAYIELEFHRDLGPYLLDLKERFKSYDIRNIQSLKSIYSIRLYILLKQYELLGQRHFELDMLKNILSISPDKYTHYGSFKQRVILRPQQEIAKHCDLYFEFEEEKEGKKVVGIIFHIYSNPKNQFGPLELSSKQAHTANKLKSERAVPKSATIECFYDKIGRYITKAELQIWIDKYGEDTLEKAIDYILSRLSEGLEIGNVPGYLQHLLKQPSITAKPEPKVRKRGAKRNAQQDKRRLEQEYQALMQEYQAKLDHVLGMIIATYPDQASILQQRALELARKVLPTATVNSQVTLAQFIRLARENFPTHFNSLQDTYEWKIANIRQAIDAHD